MLKYLFCETSYEEIILLQMDKYEKVIWLKVMRPSISSIRLYITDQSGDIVSLPRNKLSFTLLFVPDPTQ